MSDLVEFLEARIAEDEATARKVVEYQGNAGGSWSVASIETFVGATWLAEHIARWDPARVLAECEAKRRIVELHPEHGWSHCEGEPLPCPTLRILALPYADHPDFRPEWRP